MPKINIDYSNTIIYKIVCKDINIKDLYVGHTTNFVKRKYQHKFRSENENFNVYTFIRQNGGWDNFEMLEVEKHTCNNGNEARTQERFWIENLNANLNMSLPTQTMTEYCEKQKVKRSEQQKIYTIKNKDKLKVYQNQWYEKNKEQVLENSKQYNEEHKEEKREYLKSYREKYSQRFDCECGGKYTTLHRNQHFKSLKHCAYISSLQPTK